MVKKGNTKIKPITVNEWLNRVFAWEAFTPAEWAQILFGKISDSEVEIPEQERLFLLSQYQIRHYLPYKQDRICQPTAYVKATEESQYDITEYSWFYGDKKILNQIDSLGNMILGYNKKSESMIRPALWLDVTIPVLFPEKDEAEDEDDN